ncbi:threonylcarbamoyl-AMP synthase [Chromatiales bacterium (ex Bugula neritina AB1)]|nr:threonylcarbamoyl-AMP synthase [Chromatiales bacterium (ex Bugula neritina AB1)]
MSQYFEIHPDNPQSRLVAQTARLLKDGGVIVYPTDSCYAIGCLLDNKQGVERIYRLRKLPKGHHMTLMCSDLSAISTYARVDNRDYRLLKLLTPGPYTFILRSTNEVPRRFLHPKRKSIGIRVPDNTIAQALLQELGEPMMSTTMLLPGDDLPQNDGYEIRQALNEQVDLVVDGGACGLEETSVISLEGQEIEIIREGKGEVSLLQ